MEEHWDENIAKAEAEVEAAYDRRMADEETEMDDEEALATVTTTLKSIEETFEGHDIDAILKDKQIKAHEDDGSCLIAGCTDPSAMNYNSMATFNDNSCTYYGDLWAGSYSVTETCTSQDYNYTQEITSDGSTITLVNAFGWSSGDNNNVIINVSGESFEGTFEGLELENQNGETNACAYEIQGQINSNDITMSYTIYIEGENGLEEYDSCDATLTLSTGNLNSPNTVSYTHLTLPTKA